MKKIFYLLPLVFVSGCSLLWYYNPLESSEYFVDDKNIVYLTDEIMISANGDYYFNDFESLNTTTFKIRISSKKDTLAIYINDVILNDITNNVQFVLDTVSIFSENEKEIVKKNDPVIIPPKITKTMVFSFSKNDPVHINLLYYSASLEINKIIVRRNHYKVPPFRYLSF